MVVLGGASNVGAAVFSKNGRPTLKGRKRSTVSVARSRCHFYFDESGSHLDTFCAGPDMLNFAVGFRMIGVVCASGVVGDIGCSFLSCSYMSFDFEGYMCCVLVAPIHVCDGTAQTMHKTSPAGLVKDGPHGTGSLFVLASLSVHSRDAT